MLDRMKSVEGLAFVYLDETDVVRHHLVQRIVRAYDSYKLQQGEAQLSLGWEAKSIPGTKSSAVKSNGEAASPAEEAGSHIQE